MLINVNCCFYIDGLITIKSAKRSGFLWILIKSVEIEKKVLWNMWDTPFWKLTWTCFIVHAHNVFTQRDVSMTTWQVYHDRPHRSGTPEVRGQVYEARNMWIYYIKRVTRSDSGKNDPIRLTGCWVTRASTCHPRVTHIVLPLLNLLTAPRGERNWSPSGASCNPL